MTVHGFNPGLTPDQREKISTLGQRYVVARAPTVTDDSSDGYAIWDKWYDSAGQEAYVCLDATEGAAVWEQISLDIDDLGTMAVQDADIVAITGGTINGTTVGATTPAAGAFTDLETVDETTAAFKLELASNSDGTVLTADRKFTIDVNDGHRTLDLSENLTIGNGYDVTITAEDAAGTVTLDNATFEIENTNATQRDMKLSVGTDANAELSVEGTAAAVNQDVTSDASPTFTAVNATTFDTNVTAAGVTLSGVSLVADGTDLDIDINLTPKGTGEVNIPKVDIDGGTITGITDLLVEDGGTGVSTLADGGLVVGNGASAVEVVAPGATTEILVGGGAGTNPVWTTATGTDAPVRATSPTLDTPTLGEATATTINTLTLTALATGFSVAGGTASHTLTVDETKDLSDKADKTTEATPLDKVATYDADGNPITPVATAAAELVANDYGEYYIYNDTTVFTINAVDEYHLWHDPNTLSDMADGITFSAGLAATITAYADYGATVAGTVLATAATHGLATGNIISITGTTNYDGVYAVTVVDANTFYFTATWVADDATGTADKGDQLVIASTGDYRLGWSMSGSSAAANKTFKFEFFHGVVEDDKSAVERRFSATDTGSMAGSCLLSLTAGDVISFAIMCLTDATDFTVKNINVNIVTV